MAIQGCAIFIHARVTFPFHSPVTDSRYSFSRIATTGNDSNTLQKKAQLVLADCLAQPDHHNGLPPPSRPSPAPMPRLGGNDHQFHSEGCCMSWNSWFRGFSEAK